MTNACSPVDAVFIVATTLGTMGALIAFLSMTQIILIKRKLKHRIKG